jgi:glycine/D-amino acid oxidase-like deaminating enzyme/nitrite reductase/ring-hydroxylating ferredoxin subunit
MNTTHPTTNPVWGSPQRSHTHTLNGDARCDVCIVGAGIAGLSIAYHLAVANQSVIVLDDGPIGGGQTGRTTAHLTAVLDDRYAKLERLRGLDAARLAAASHSAAIDCIEQRVRDERIDCSFARLDGYLFDSPGSAPDVLEEELGAARRAGLAVQILSQAPIDSFDTGRCLQFPHQAQFHPLKYLDGLVRGIARRGGRIVTGTHVARVDGGKPAWITLQGGQIILADAVVVATNVPINDLLAIHTKQAAYLTYVIAAPIPAAAAPHGLFWDTLEPYHYIRVQTDPSSANSAPMNSTLIIGGEDHRTGQADDGAERFARLETWARQRFPTMGEITNRWSGQVMETIDGLAFIGRNPLDADNVYVVTGDSGMGMTHGTIAGMLVSDLILGRENPWVDLYDPARRPLRGILGFAGETLNMASQYSDWLTGGDVKSTAEIPTGAGAVLRRGLHKMAVYRDDRGELHEFSAACQHLGCIVHWNHAENTWDCPCHGSRFASDGRVIGGPANTDLAPVRTQETVLH